MRDEIKDPVDKALKAISWSLSHCTVAYEYKDWNRFHDLGPRTEADSLLYEPPRGWVYRSYPLSLRDTLHKSLERVYEVAGAGVGMKAQLAAEAWLEHLGEKPLYWDAEK
jgi:hypothetical protein